MDTKRITRIAFFCALALILGLIESLLTPLFAFAPYAKLGLANVAALIAIVILGFSDAIVIQIIRCLLGGAISGGLFGLLFSLPAGAISLTIMILLYKFMFPKISLMGISFAGATAHNLTQVVIATIIYPQINLGLLLANYILASVIAGLFVGIVSFFVIKYLPRKAYL